MNKEAEENTNIKRIAVFCGSNSGKNQLYKEKAYELGQSLAVNNFELVYGGAKVGLMGIIADGCLENNGKVYGVIPDFLRSREITHKGVTKLFRVESMHERKLKMNELCDAVIAMPGGFGTLDELFEMLTWGQLGLHKKPIGIWNINGFFDALLAMLDNMVSEGFLKSENREMVLVSRDLDQLLEVLHQYKPPSTGKWINAIQI